MELRYGWEYFLFLSLAAFRTRHILGKSVNFHLLRRINGTRPLIFLHLDSSEIRRTLEPKSALSIPTVSTNTFLSTNFFLFFSLPCFYYGVAPFSAYKHTHNPQFLLSL